MAKVLLEEEQVSYKASRADISNLKFQRYNFDTIVSSYSVQVRAILDIYALFTSCYLTNYLSSP